MTASLIARLWTNFQDGGWGMYPIVVFGFVTVGAAGRFAWRGEHQLVSFVRWMTATVLAAGAFGFAVGMMQVFAFIVFRAKAEERLLALFEGGREALNNVSASLLFVTLGCLLLAIGHRRFPQPNPSALVR